MTAARVAVVTGATRGIGFEVCRQLARRGVQVVLTGRTADHCEAAAQVLRAEQLDVEPRALDVTQPAQVAELAAFVQHALGRCDILVNNAGVMLDPRGSRVLDAGIETFHATFETNFYGALRLSQALVPLMRRHGYGRLVNLSSGLGQLDDMQDGQPAYRVSKAALNALTRMLAAATRDDNILVNSVCPGWVRTRMGGPGATRDVAQGADTVVWLATLPDGGPSGGFFRDRQRIAW